MKVARRLKYSVHETDLTALQRELSGAPGDPDAAFEEELEDDPYAVLAGSAEDGDGPSDDEWDIADQWTDPDSR